MSKNNFHKISKMVHKNTLQEWSIYIACNSITSLCISKYNFTSVNWKNWNMFFNVHMYNIYKKARNRPFFNDISSNNTQSCNTIPRCSVNDTEIQVTLTPPNCHSRKNEANLFFLDFFSSFNVSPIYILTDINFNFSMDMELGNPRKMQKKMFYKWKLCTVISIIISDQMLFLM